MLIALGMLFASCQMDTPDSSVSGYSAVSESSNIKGVTLTIGEITNTERTILPADWNDGTAEKLTYVLLAKKSNGPSGYETKATFSYSELTGGTAVVNLDLVEWDLKLIGYITNESYQTHPCLEKELLGEDFSTGKKTVVFDLEPTDPTKTSATGNVDVTITWLTDKALRLEFGIYDIGKKTDEIVEDTGRMDALFSETKAESSFAVAGTAHEMSFQPKNIKAGMYKFAEVFYNAATGGDVIGYYIDNLYVDGGNDSIATVNYGDKFNTQPDNPTWLAVETVFIPQELTATNTTVNDWYYAKFHWNDIATNETGFELVIDDGSNEEVVNPTKLASSPLKSDYLLDGTTAATATNNNLDAGSTSVVLKLKTETLYTAKIRAINKYTPDYDDADDDDFCDNLNRNGDGKGRDYAPIVGDDKQFGMFTVNYALDGGTVTKAKLSTTDENVTNYVVGFNYHSEQQDLMTDDILSYPFVSKIGYVFDYWNDATSGKLEVIPAKNTDNLTLTAVWGGSEVRVSVTFPSYASANDVKIAADQNSDNTVKFKYSAENNSISVTAGASLVTPGFELTEVGDNGKPIETGTSVSGSKWTWTPTKKPTPGLYCLQITGTYKDPGTGRTLTLCGNVYINVEN